MKTNFFTLVLCVVAALSLSSCATLFTKSSKEITFKGIPGTTVIETDKGKFVAEVGNNGFATAKIKKRLKSKTFRAQNDGFKPYTFKLDTKIQNAFWGNIILGGVPGMGIDVATGKMMTWKDDVVDITLTPLPKKDPEPVEETQVVTRESPGKTDMEKSIVRWYFDSDPRGARIFYRVISSVPDEVKNTNETYMTTTPLEETKPFNIIGLTYDNSPNITIEIKVTKRGYEDQVKRFNVRQALDQQEISSFFELVPKDN
ncbi:MAG: hypothetical protein K2N28_09370 [Muribaculaceae bacterium]|nr:hypothetical protein [Muribaculaceae bacterium]